LPLSPSRAAGDDRATRGWCTLGPLGGRKEEKRGRREREREREREKERERERERRARSVMRGRGAGERRECRRMGEEKRERERERDGGFTLTPSNVPFFSLSGNYVVKREAIKTQEIEQQSHLRGRRFATVY